MPCQRLLLAAALAAVVGTAAAQSAAPTPQVRGAVTVVSGGIGLDEAAAMKQLSSRYPLRIVMSRPNGAYHVAERLAILRGGNVVAEVDGAGPWVLADVAPGRYTLHGTFGGREHVRQVVVDHDGTTVHWVVDSPLG